MTGFIVFAHRHVNLHRMAESEGLNYSYLWKIFNGSRVPSLAYSRKIAKALDMDHLAFLAELEAHVGVTDSAA